MRPRTRRRSWRWTSFSSGASSISKTAAVIDQPFQARLSEGVVRCYMAGDGCAGLWPPEGQGTGRRTGRTRQGGTAVLHLQRRPALPAPAPAHGRRVDAAADILTGHFAAGPAVDLGRGLARPTRRRRDRQLCAWRDQCQLGIPDARGSAGRDRPPSCRSAAVEDARIIGADGSDIEVPVTDISMTLSRTRHHLDGYVRQALKTRQPSLVALGSVRIMGH